MPNAVFSALLALLSLSIGAALCRYAVYKSGEIRAWRMWVALAAAIPFLAAAELFFLQGVLGWPLIR